MGVIVRQASKRSVLAYIGAIIGIGSQLWIYSLAFDVYGEVQFILSMITLFLPFASFGIIGLVNRFYPYFKDRKKSDNGFLGILLIGGVLSFIVFTGLAYLFQDAYFNLIAHLGFDLSAFKDYNYIIFGSLFFAIIGGIFAAYSSNFKRIVIPFALNSLSWKVILPIVVLTFVAGLISKKTAYESILITYALISTGLIIYYIVLGEFKIKAKISTVFKANYKSMTYFALYGIIASVGSILALRIDKVMLRGLTDDFNTGVYSSFVVLSALILFPCDAVINISSPLVAGHWKDNNLQELKKLNNQSSNILLLAGLFLFLLTFINLDDIFRMTSKYAEFSLGFKAFLFLGIAKTIDSAFGINGVILIYSKFYYLSFVAMIILAVTNIYLNLKLIPDYGMTGAAIASCFSIVLYNLFYYVFNWVKFGIQAFGRKELLMFIILVVGGLISNYLYFDFHFIIRIICRSVALILLTVPLIWYFKLSPEFNKFISKTTFLNRSNNG